MERIKTLISIKNWSSELKNSLQISEMFHSWGGTIWTKSHMGQFLMENRPLEIPIVWLVLSISFDFWSKIAPKFQLKCVIWSPWDEVEFLQFYTCGIDVWGNSLHLLDLKYWLRGLFEPWKIFCPNSCFFCSNGLSSWWLQINFNNDFFQGNFKRCLTSQIHHKD